ncbi:alkaline phosphatase family protein [Pleurocapsa sp. PCC 7319]|uniref:alkaline phosphatase family protein n=1 Tax=Pleurocapsa sp. PCC 7319 TaxID=118161 RepID=UPI0003623523|nr:alkaline phosphatase family protein [Pleurocapsa sp. PCC 7319]
MKQSTIVLGLDAAEPRLIEDWMAAGHLPNLSRICQAGIYGRLDNTVNYCGVPTEYSTTEPLWATFSTGCRADTLGYWDTVSYNPDNYKIVCDIVTSGYDYQEYPPFYALGENYKVAVLDVPVTTLTNNLNGVQILGWGGHYPYTVSASNPPEIFDQIIQKYGKNPVLHNDNGLWWNPKYVTWIQEALTQSIEGHCAIACELLKQEQWDLFLMVFGETHTVGHDLYNHSQADHPVYNFLSNKGTKPDPVLNVYQQVDTAIGEILESAPQDVNVLCFSVHGMAANFTDLLSMAVLPELLYRFHFGKAAIAPGKVGSTPDPIVTKPIRNSWPGEIWSQVYEPNPLKKLFRTWTHKKFLRGSKHGLLSPYSLLDEPIEQELAMGWMPSMWYSPLWPEMKAFALPAFTNGHIRINLKGRDRDGVVEASEYDALCTELTEILHDLVDGRNGHRVVKQVVKTHSTPLDDNPKLPDADLVVIWQEPITDVVDSSRLGRVGPLTHCRAGGHKGQGFLLAKGPDVPAGTGFSSGETVDLAPTILNLMNAEIPQYFDGKTLFQNASGSV